MRRRAGNPGRVLRFQLLLEEQRVIVALHYYELIRLEPLVGDIPGLCGCVGNAADADTLSLADGVEGKPDVLPQPLAVLVHDRAWNLRQVTVQELAERPLADEADAGRVLLRVVRQPGLSREPPHLGLLHFADRKHHARELLLVQAVQEIALVLARIHAS